MRTKEELAKEWSPKLGSKPFSTLEQQLSSMESFRLEPSEVPFIIRFIENPKYDFGIFPGPVSLYNHDCIHIVLGRGVLTKDEAFVIGFTMGSTDKVGLIREASFCAITKHLYPEGYKFSQDDLTVYKAGLSLARNMNCKDLSKVDFKKFKNLSIPRLRRELGIDIKTLRYYYYLEKQMFPNCIESQRLV